MEAAIYHSKGILVLDVPFQFLENFDPAGSLDLLEEQRTKILDQPVLEASLASPFGDSVHFLKLKGFYSSQGEVVHFVNEGDEFFGDVQVHEPRIVVSVLALQRNEYCFLISGRIELRCSRCKQIFLGNSVQELFGTDVANQEQTNQHDVSKHERVQVFDHDFIENGESAQTKRVELAVHVNFSWQTRIVIALVLLLKSNILYVRKSTLSAKVFKNIKLDMPILARLAVNPRFPKIARSGRQGY
jgi:hypothetical protein